jgi:hypothetical protein
MLSDLKTERAEQGHRRGLPDMIGQRHVRQTRHYGWLTNAGWSNKKLNLARTLSNTEDYTSRRVAIQVSVVT